MAFLSSNYLDKEQQQNPDGSPFTPGVGAGPGSAGGTSAQSMGGGTQQGGQQGTGFVNASQFLGANQQGAQALGQSLNDRVSGETSDAQAAQSYNANQYYAGGAGGRGGNNTRGPQSQTAGITSGSAGYGDAAQKTQTAVGDANALGDSYGRQGLLQGMYGNAGGYTQGQSAWDSALAGQGGNYAGYEDSQKTANGVASNLGRDTATRPQQNNWGPPTVTGGVSSPLGPSPSTTGWKSGRVPWGGYPATAQASTGNTLAPKQQASAQPGAAGAGQPAAGKDGPGADQAMPIISGVSSLVPGGPLFVAGFNALKKYGDAGSGFDKAMGSVSSWENNAFNNAGDWINGAGNTVGNWFNPKKK